VIKVVRIAGESYDLETGAEMPKALVLSNGVREVSIHVDDSVINEVVQMMQESPSAPAPIAAPVEPPGGNGGLELPDVDLQTPRISTTQPRPAVNLEAEIAAAEATVAGEGFEPGEEYDDPGTGAASW
jgi:hypothetical protein